MEELYRSDTIVVRKVACEDQRRWVITFDNHSIGAGFDRPGFGEAFLQNEGISAIHVLGRGNDWYHYPDVLTAARVVRRATRDAKRRMTYGSSMGGFAALHLARAVGANAVLALSPQYAIDPAVVPWETRWEQDGARIQPTPGLTGPIRCRCRPVVIYDPTEPDARHVSMIAADTAITPIALPFTGHPVTTFLAETGMLRQIVTRILGGAFNATAARRRLRRRRGDSTVYLGRLAERQPAWRPRTALALARRSAVAGGGGALGSLSFARILTRAGDHAEAIEHYRRAVDLGNRDTNLLVAYAEGLLAARDTASARAVAEEAIARTPDPAHLHHWHAWVCAADRDYVAALAAEERACALHPGFALYERSRANYAAKVDPALLRRAFGQGIDGLSRALGRGRDG